MVECREAAYRDRGDEAISSSYENRRLYRGRTLLAMTFTHKE
jgi:hypothetical protein